VNTLLPTIWTRNIPPLVPEILWQIDFGSASRVTLKLAPDESLAFLEVRILKG
jgi:hypothetical protein